MSGQHRSLIEVRRIEGSAYYDLAKNEKHLFSGSAFTDFLTS